MRINSFSSENRVASTKSSPKNVNELQAGDKFKATILDIKRGEVTIKTSDGNVITAKSLIVPDARIGDIMEFTVQANKDGQILISMLSEEQSSKMQLNTLVDVLFSANIMPNDEMLALVKSLMDNGLPVDKSSLQNAMQLLKNNPELDVDTLAFMLKEEIDINAENIEQVKLTSQNQNQIKEQINDLAFKIAGIDEPQIRNQILSIFLPELSESQSQQIMSQLKEFGAIQQHNLLSNIANQADLKEFATSFKEATDFVLDKFLDKNNPSTEINKIVDILKNDGDINEALDILSQSSGKQIFDLIKNDNKLSNMFKEFLNKLIEFEMDSKFNIKSELLGNAIKESLFIDLKDKNNLNKLNDYYQDLYNKLSKSIEITQKGSTENTLEASKSMTDIKNNVEFMNNINKYQEFIQIPFQIGNTQNQGDLYVFSEKKGKRISKDISSVLISLDLSMLGHFEVFIKKDYKNISCQFRTMDKKVQSLVQLNISKLQMLLKQKGYNLNQVMYKTIDEPFNILKDREELGFEMEEVQQNNKRYSFDMRA